MSSSSDGDGCGSLLLGIAALIIAYCAYGWFADQHEAHELKMQQAGWRKPEPKPAKQVPGVPYIKEQKND
jgi:hypothetical protein